MTATLTIIQTTKLPDGQVERESVVLPMPSGDAAHDLMRTMSRLLQNAPGGGFAEYGTKLNQERITLASGDRITLKVEE